jgi:hypothetical protein
VKEVKEVREVKEAREVKEESRIVRVRSRLFVFVP